MTNAELAILSLIAQQPRHGYEIEQVIEERGMRDWTEVGFSSIYYLLNKLEKDNLIEGHVERHVGQGPARKVYRITEAGRETVHAGVLTALSVPQRTFPLLQLGLANLPVIPRSEALDALGKYCINLSDRLGYVQRKRDRQRPLPYFVETMFSHSITMIKAERSWIEDLIKQLEEKSD